ncbi:TPA: hypothetical protein ACH3X1_007394 [Trebouxia sp. C0004]
MMHAQGCLRAVMRSSCNNPSFLQQKTTFPCPASMYSALMVEVATTCPATKTVLKMREGQGFHPSICSDHWFHSEARYSAVVRRCFCHTVQVMLLLDPSMMRAEVAIL